MARPKEFSEPLHQLTAYVPESIYEVFAEEVYRTRMKQQDAIRAAIANWTAQQKDQTNDQPTSKQKAPV